MTKFLATVKFQHPIFIFVNYALDYFSLIKKSHYGLLFIDRLHFGNKNTVKIRQESPGIAFVRTHR